MGEGVEFVLWCLAIGGTALFLIKILLLFMGADHGGDADGGFGDMGGHDIGGHDVGDVDHGDAHHGDSTTAFNLLSIQSLATLAMGTGWMGLAAMRSLHLGDAAAVLLGLAFGIAMVFMMGKLLLKARQLESSGTLDVQEALGQTGSVYLSIPEGGKGQVQIVVQGRLVTLDARSPGAAIPTGTKILVEEVDSTGVLVVAPV